MSGATLQAELTHLGPGFFACPGAAGEVVEEHRGRLGLLPVFLACQQLAWVELETGAELHARLLLTRSELPGPPSSSAWRRGDRKVHDTHPVVVAAYPHGASWPPAPDLGARAQAGPAGSGDGRRAPSPWPGSSTCSRR